MPSPKLFRQDGDESREFTADEYVQHTKDQIATKTENDTLLANATKEQNDKDAAVSKLVSLGITTAEIDALIG